MSALSAGNFKPLENKEDIGKAPCQSSIFGVKYKPNMKNIQIKLESEIIRRGTTII